MRGAAAAGRRGLWPSPIVPPAYSGLAPTRVERRHRRRGAARAPSVTVFTSCRTRSTRHGVAQGCFPEGRSSSTSSPRALPAARDGAEPTPGDGLSLRPRRRHVHPLQLRARPTTQGLPNPDPGLFGDAQVVEDKPARAHPASRRGAPRSPVVAGGGGAAAGARRGRLRRRVDWRGTCAPRRTRSTINFWPSGDPDDSARSSRPPRAQFSGDRASSWLRAVRGSRSTRSEASTLVARRPAPSYCRWSPTDNRTPEPLANVTQTAPVRLRVVGGRRVPAPA